MLTEKVFPQMLYLESGLKNRKTHSCRTWHVALRAQDPLGFVFSRRSACGPQGVLAEGGERVRCVTGSEARKGVMERGRRKRADPGSGGGHGWEVVKKNSLNKMEIWESRSWPAYQFIIRAKWNGRPRVDTLEGDRGV